jgi:hypothetical protein
MLALTVHAAKGAAAAQRRRNFALPEIDDEVLVRRRIRRRRVLVDQDLNQPDMAARARRRASIRATSRR